MNAAFCIFALLALLLLILVARVVWRVKAATTRHKDYQSGKTD